ncbi:DUF4360 domain-containing protein [Oligoflexus tunisiensis]|uniref:DUF4360 domain-containing protein n=1 Tax=Oligoflexus tunisiensis TaxID=708132 RepID=UPI00114CD916|nr:DUF4360 domain-containing protein [Oligoflexus tunisiensis]
MMKQLIALTLLASSTASFAGWTSHGRLQVNEDSIKFIGNGCSADDAFVSFNGDGSFDLVFTNLEAVTGEGVKNVTKTCQFKFDARIPAGLTFTTSRAGIAGFSNISSENGQTLATLRHTLGGQVSDAAIASYTYADGSVQDVVLNKDLHFAKKIWNPCGKDTTFKTTVTVNAKGDDAVISISEGAQSGKTYSIRYYWTWKSC